MVSIAVLSADTFSWIHCLGGAILRPRRLIRWAATRRLMFHSRSGRSGSPPKFASLVCCLASVVVSAAHAQSIDSRGLDLVCPLVEHESLRHLEDARFNLELLENEYRARLRIFEMIQKLWDARSIDQEAYLDYKRLRDRTKARIARSTTQISQRSRMAEQYALTCAQVRGESIGQIQKKIDDLQAEYRRLDCVLLARDSAIAEIDYEFDRAILKSTRTLAERNIKSRYELVLEEYDLSQSKARFDSYRARTTACKRRLAG